MNKLTKQCGIIAVLGVIVFCACVFASCDRAEPPHFYVRNTLDEEITVYISHHTSPGGWANQEKYVGSITIPAHSTGELEVFLGEMGVYEVIARLPNGTYVSKYASWNMGADEWWGESILVIF